MALLIQMAATFASARGIAGALMPADTVKALGDLPALVEDVASTCDASVREAAEQMASASLIIFTGLGPNLGAAAIGAAKIRELSTIHAISYPLEEMHHYRAQKRGDLVVLVATDSAARERALDTALVSEAVRGRLIAILAMEDPDIEARAAHVIRVPPVQPWLTGLVSCVPLHVFAYHFAKARDAAGLGYSGVW